MTLPLPILGVLIDFRIAFTEPTWKKTLVLFVGAILAPGRRTVSAALRAAGHAHDLAFSKYHDVFSRARWSPLFLAKLLLSALLKAFVASEVVLVVDETLERRRGPKIGKRSHHRDPLASSTATCVTTSGLRWIVMALVVRVPWSKHAWALPVLSRIAPSLKNDQQLKRRHKTVVDHARQMITLIRRWLPDRVITVLGDGAYSVLALGLRCRRLRVRLIAPLPWNACLCEPLPAQDSNQPQPKKRGRPRKAGPRLPTPRQVLENPRTAWRTVQVRQADGSPRELEVCEGVAWWSHAGEPPLPVRWVVTRDPSGQWQPRCYFSTMTEDSAEMVAERASLRWAIEVTFEEMRAQLGMETQRNWCDQSIEREMPCLLGLYSLVALIGMRLWGEGEILTRTAAWYDKKEATFADVLGAVRRLLWRNADGIFPVLADKEDSEKSARILEIMVETLCYPQ